MYIQLIVLLSSNELGIHRHRSLTGDSNPKGTLIFDKLLKLAFFHVKYVFTMSVSDKNPNLNHTNL